MPPNQTDIEAAIEPNILAVLESEQAYVASTSRFGKHKRVKIPKGHEWLSRFLPVTLGPNNTFFARLAYHWIGPMSSRRPYPCRRHTAEDFGGDRNAQCEVCDAAEELNGSSDKRISSIGYKATAVPQWLMYCLIFEQSDGRDTTKITGDEQWQAWEFLHNKANFEDFISIYRKGLRRCPLSVLDLVQGNDIWIKHTQTKGFTFEREDPMPIYEDYENTAKFQEIVNRIWSTIKFEPPQFPKPDALEKLALKLKEFAEDGDEGNERGGEEEDGERSSRSSGGRSSRAPSRASAPTVPPRSASPAQAPVVAAPVVAAPVAKAPAPAPAAPRVGPPAVSVAAPVAVSTAPAVAAPSAAVASAAPRVTPPRVTPPVAAAPVAARPAAAPTVSTVDDEEDNVTREPADPAPAAAELPPEQPAPPADTAAAAPPRVAATGAVLGDRISRGIAGLSRSSRTRTS